MIGIDTMLAASASALTAAFITEVRFGKPDASLTANGWVGGLVASSASCAFVSPAEAVVIGSIAGAVITFSIEWFELRMEVDDPGGSVSVHAVGTFGAPRAGRVRPISAARVECCGRISARSDEWNRLRAVAGSIDRRGHSVGFRLAADLRRESAPQPLLSFPRCRSRESARAWTFMSWAQARTGICNAHGRVPPAIRYLAEFPRLDPGNANLPIGARKAPIGRLAFPGKNNNLFNPSYPVFEFVFGPGLLHMLHKEVINNS